MSLIVWGVFVVSVICGLISGFNYLSDPLQGTKYIRYSGGVFWVGAFFSLIALYLGRG